MDNKITKERIAVHFEYDWLKYLLVLAVSIFAFYMVFYQINVTRDFEKIEVFFTCYQSNAQTQNTDYLSYMDGKTRPGGTAYNTDAAGNRYVIEATVEFQSLTNKDYGTLYQTHGSVADILVIGRSYMVGSATSFLPLTDEILQLILPTGMATEDIDYFAYTDEELNEVVGDSGSDAEIATKNRIKNERYGIRVDNLAGIGTGLAAAFVFDPAVYELDPETYDSEFYMVIRTGSVNLGDLNPKASTAKKYGNKEKYGDLYQTLYYVQYFLNSFGFSSAG